MWCTFLKACLETKNILKMINFKIFFEVKVVFFNGSQRCLILRSKLHLLNVSKDPFEISQFFSIKN